MEAKERNKNESTVFRWQRWRKWQRKKLRSSDGGELGGTVAIHRQMEPDEHNRATVERYYMTGNRNVLTSWDEDGNELDHEITIQEPVRLTFKTRAEAEAYARKMKYKYMNL